MTRAEYILMLLYEREEDSMAGTVTEGISPIGYAGRGIGTALTTGLIIHGVRQAKAKTRDKIAKGGLGQEHKEVTADLHKARVQNVKHLGLSSKLRAGVQSQKAKVRDIENRGLERYHKGMTASQPS